MKKFNLLYDGEVIHRNLSHEQALEVLQGLSERFYSSTSEGKDNIDANLIKMEEVNG